VPWFLFFLLFGSSMLSTISCSPIKYFWPWVLHCNWFLFLIPFSDILALTTFQVLPYTEKCLMNSSWRWGAQKYSPCLLALSSRGVSDFSRFFLLLHLSWDSSFLLGYFDFGTDFDNPSSTKSESSLSSGSFSSSSASLIDSCFLVGYVTMKCCPCTSS
jgi:hypothetical protein